MQAHAYNSHGNGLTVERVHVAGSSGEEDKGCGGVRRRKEGALVVARQEPGRKWKSSSVGKNKSHSFWTRREEVKVLQNWDRWTHQEGKRAFLLDTHPDKHQAQPPCLITTRVPESLCFSWGRGAAGPASHMGGWDGHHFQFGNGPEARDGWEERRSVQGHQHYSRHPPALGSPQEGDQVPTGLPAALGSLQLEQIRQRKKSICHP